MRWFNISVVFAAMLLILGLASSAQAADVMYKASLSIQAFGNDTTTGLSYPFNSTVFVGVPFGLTCNPYYGAGTNWCIGTTSMAQAGSPLTGSGSASVTGFAPAAFTLPLSGLSRVLGTPGVPGGSFYGYYPYMYSFTYADLKNSNASFFGGGGPGNLSWPYTTSGASRVARIVVKQGANRFGGTMRLLGSFHARFGYYRDSGLSVGDKTWLFQYLGAGGSYSGTKLTTPGSVTAKNTAKHTRLMSTLTRTVKARPIGWTTGTVTVTATARGPFVTVQQRNGYDNRTDLGSKGTIQFVSPMLTHWLAPWGDHETGAVGVLNIQFLPEPSGWLLLTAGVGVLVVLRRVSRQG